MNKGPYDEASDVVAESGEVQVDGPDGVSVSMTPQAAAETSDRLLKGATEAADQRIMSISRKQRPSWIGADPLPIRPLSGNTT